MAQTAKEKTIVQQPAKKLRTPLKLFMPTVKAVNAKAVLQNTDALTALAGIHAQASNKMFCENVLAPLWIINPLQRAAYIKSLLLVKNPYTKTNGMPRAGKDKLFFEFEQKRRQLEIAKMGAVDKIIAKKAMKNLNDKMDY